MDGPTPERIRALLLGWSGPPQAGPVLTELALCFCVVDGFPDPLPFQLAATLAHALGAPAPKVGDATTDTPSAALLQRVQGLVLRPDDGRALLRCLFMIGVARGSLSSGQRSAVAGVAKATGVPTSELNALARAALSEAGRSSSEARALPAGELALISDIHANIAALEAVFADIDAQGIRRVGCLGDVVGYGPDPIECVDLIRERCSFTLMGNHDIAVFEGADGFNPPARKAIEWTRDLLERGAGAQAQARLEFLRNLPLERREGKSLFVHGSPRDPWREYIFPHEAKSKKAHAKLKEIFKSFEEFLFVGHTHLPCVITHEAFVATSTDLDDAWKRPPGIRAIVNVGSVGQPRDKDPRPCYAIVSEDMIRWRRVEYERERTIVRIQRNAALDPVLAKRLVRGV